MPEDLQFEYGDKTILEIVNLWEGGHLNLTPGFQRNSVWTLSDRRKLIDSLLLGYPLPSIFLYRRDDQGHLVYDVVDGKQRLESIFMFIGANGFKRQTFDLITRPPGSEDEVRISWKWLERNGKGAWLHGRKIQTVEVSGSLSSIVDLFVRINSTGRALTSAEKRHARFYDNRLLREANRIAHHFSSYLKSERIISNRQLLRMKDVELCSELLVSVLEDGPINKKSAVDRVIGNHAVKEKDLKRASQEVAQVFRLLRKMFPELRSTRFCHISEFYTLFLVVWQLWRENMILTDRKRNAIAASLLRRLSSGVDLVRLGQRKLRWEPGAPKICSEYLLTVQQSTDTLAQRRRRAEIVRGVFGGLFERKDASRIFSPEQRRLLWNSEERKRCCSCGCELDWESFQVDHIKPYARGGKTSLDNAALICLKCNAAKGARRSKRR